MTRLGIITRLYAQHVEPRPFSRFATDSLEREANLRWLSSSLEWGRHRVDEFGNFRGLVNGCR